MDQVNCTLASSATKGGLASLAAARRRRLPFPSPLPATRAGDAWRLQVEGRELRLSNLDKVYWPDDGITKGDLLAYYWNVADLILPHLHDRPLTMKRMPDGLAGEPFYEKQVPAHAPDWLPTAAVPTEEDSRVVEFVLVQDRASLLYVVNLGCIEMHPLHSRAGSLDRPDYAFFDLDPFEPYTYGDVRTVAKLVKVVLDGLGLRGYAKTSGATGMQVFVPLDGTHTHSDAREFVERVGRLVVRAYPEKATMAWPVADRAGKIFIDHQMNRAGANIASAYSLRPLPGAPVSTPLDWDELDDDIEPNDFRIDNVWDRFAGGDRFRSVLDDKQSLTQAMEALGLTPGTPEEPRGRSRPRFPAKRATRPSSRATLDEYVAKRDFARTPEPSGAPDPHPRLAAPEPPPPVGAPEPPPPAEEHQLPEGPHPAGLTEVAPLVEGRRFTIQQHHARRLHHDVRFERDGVLVSFAVPKRLPEEPGVRHLAVSTEDHPLDYLTFGGTIPAGEYGGGEVRLFDLGSYEPLEVADGKLTVRLHGTRYQGAEYHLFRTRDRDWLVILKGRVSLPQPAPPPTYEPMMAVLTAKAFDDDEWLFEVKWDGHRCLANLGTSTRLTSRTRRDMTAQFPELIDMHRQLAARNAVVDGEIVALDRDGRPSFERMQDRFHRTPEELARNKGRVPVQFLAFDLLWLDGQPLLELPLHERRARLVEVLVETRDIRLSQVVEGAGTAFFEQVKSLQLEGIVAKRAASPYRPGTRSHDWRKIKALCLQDCVIVGWTPGKGGRAATLGSLLLAVYDDGRLRYAGNVGTGFTHAFLADLLDRLQELQVARPMFEGFEDTLRPRGARFVRPELVCEVEYLRWTEDNKLRASSFKGLRPDKPPTDARREHPVDTPS
jgi:bifunctional non-homologous end joining protein LigD